jgi:hypothetical protein
MGFRFRVRHGAGNVEAIAPCSTGVDFGVFGGTDVVLNGTRLVSDLDDLLVFRSPYRPVEATSLMPLRNAVAGRDRTPKQSKVLILAQVQPVGLDT